MPRAPYSRGFQILEAIFHRARAQGQGLYIRENSAEGALAGVICQLISYALYRLTYPVGGNAEASCSLF